jgi:hypothetical protein
MIYLHPSSEWLPRQRIWNTMYRSCGVWQISSTWTKSLTSCNVISWNPKLTDMMLFDDHQHWCRDHVKNHSNVDQFHMSRWPPNVTSEIMCQNHPQIVSLFMGGYRIHEIGGPWCVKMCVNFVTFRENTTQNRGSTEKVSWFGDIFDTSVISFGVVIYFIHITNSRKSTRHYIWYTRIQ